jgi:uncharacterized protein (TIGR03437 family)
MIRIGFSTFAFLCLTAPAFAQTTAFTISTVAGTTVPAFFGDNGAATSADLNTPIAVAVDSSGNLYIADSANERIRKVTKSSGKISTIAGTGIAQYTGDGAAATAASLNIPYGIAVDAAGNVYISDLKNHAVRKIGTNGNITTIAGTGTFGYTGDGGPAASAQLNQPIGLAFDSAGNLYIADSNNYCVRKIDTSGIITTVAGVGGSLGFSGDGGQATKAKLTQPFGIAVDGRGNLYITDSGNHRVREVSNGVITTIAGSTKGFNGDNGPAAKALLNNPWGILSDANGNLLVSDYGNYRVRSISAAGIITTVAGFAPNYGGDGGAATLATLNSPTGLAADSSGNIYIADAGNNVIRQLTPSAPTISAGGVVSASQFGAFTTIAPGSWIEIYGSNLAGNARSWTGADFTNGGAAAPTSLDGNSVTIGGQPAYIDYISGVQINAQVPSNVGTGQQQVVVASASGGKATFNVTVAATQPGIFAPSQFVVNGKQYAGALANDGVTFIMPPGAVSGITSQRAKAGDRITLYGIGFGPVTPTFNAGQVVSAQNALPSNFQVQIGGAPATIQYAGLAPGYVGLYQINVFVPANAASNDFTPITFSLNGTAGTQTLYIAVQ